MRIHSGDGRASFGFNVQRIGQDDRLHGHLNYNHGGERHVVSTGLSSLVVSRDHKTAIFSGTCTDDGAPCTFTVIVEDIDEPGRDDSFTIYVSGEPLEGGDLRTGNVQIHWSD